jgi:hypothetical protein
MFKVSLVATALVVALSLSAQAQTQFCWNVVMPHRDSPNPIGTILIDRCSGKTFLLWPATDQSWRWFPLRVEEKEMPLSSGDAAAPAPPVKR